MLATVLAACGWSSLSSASTTSTSAKQPSRAFTTAEVNPGQCTPAVMVVRHAEDGDNPKAGEPDILNAAGSPACGLVPEAVPDLSGRESQYWTRRGRSDGLSDRKDHRDRPDEEQRAERKSGHQSLLHHRATCRVHQQSASSAPVTGETLLSAARVSRPAGPQDPGQGSCRAFPTRPCTTGTIPHA